MKKLGFSRCSMTRRYNASTHTLPSLARSFRRRFLFTLRLGTRGRPEPALLIERKITWAESARRAMATNERLQQALAEADVERREEARQNAAIAAPILMQMMQNPRPVPYVPPPVPTYQPPLRLQTTCTTIGQITSCN